MIYDTKHILQLLRVVVVAEAFFPGQKQITTSANVVPQTEPVQYGKKSK